MSGLKITAIADNVVIVAPLPDGGAGCLAESVDPHSDC